MVAAISQLSWRHHNLWLAMLLWLAQSVSAFDPYVTPDIHLENLVGTWTLQIGSMRHVLTFKAGTPGKNGVQEGTFGGVFYVGNQISDEYEGTWRLNPGYIKNPTLSYVYTKSRRISAGTKDSDSIQTLNDRKMVVLTSEGHNGAIYRVWQRMKDK